MAARTIRDAVKGTHVHFTGVKCPASLPGETRRSLQLLIEEAEEFISSDDQALVHSELRAFFFRHVSGDSHKLGAFVGVLSVLQSLGTSDQDRRAWWGSVVRPIICSPLYPKPAVEDAQDLLLRYLIEDGSQISSDVTTGTAQDVPGEILHDLLDLYILRMRAWEGSLQATASEDALVTQQILSVLLSYGCKSPQMFFLAVDRIVLVPETRLQALALLASLLRHETPHLYQITDTPLLGHILICLMNDTSFSILSAALTVLVMAMPHVPSSLVPHLPRLFLVYSRLLCWEKFNPLSTEAQMGFVTDARVPVRDQLRSTGVGIDLDWEVARPTHGTDVAATPKLLSYFTLLYGMYPLNLASYIRKPRRYLRNVDFPGAEDFDLDRSVIRSRTEQFRRAHLLHSNFYNLTIEEELVDPRWLKMEAADVVDVCHGLRYNRQTSSVKALRVFGSSADVSISGPRSPHVQDPRPSRQSSTQQNNTTSNENPQAYCTPVADLQTNITLLRTELDYERWLTLQYSQYIGQQMRKNVKDATAEAEVLNLINANRALKQQIEQLRQQREETIKDAMLTRKSAGNMENSMVERVKKLKKDQEALQAKADEWKKLKEEHEHYYELLVAAESREFNANQRLTIALRDLQDKEDVQTRLSDVLRKLHDYERTDRDGGAIIEGSVGRSNPDRLPARVRDLSIKGPSDLLPYGQTTKGIGSDSARRNRSASC